MELEEFIRCIRTIMYEEYWQTRKGKAIKNSMNIQRSNINKIGKALGLKRLTETDFHNLINYC